MARQKRSKKGNQGKSDNGARLGFEEKLWLAAEEVA